MQNEAEEKKGIQEEEERAEQDLMLQAESIAEEVCPDPGPSSGKKRSKAGWILLAAVILLFVCSGVYKIYMDVSFQPAVDPKDMETGDLNVRINDNMIVVRNNDMKGRTEKVGIIFYSALRVDPGCYYPLMVRLSQQGYDCFLPIAFGNQSYLNTAGADKIIRKFTSVVHWYLAGHAGGCDQAARYAAAHPDRIEGLIFLGGAPGLDLSGLPKPLLSISGSEDTMISEKKRERAKKNAPAESGYEIIPGGNGTGFTNSTAVLDGDSPAKIDPEEQIDITAALMDSFIQEHYKPLYS